MANYDIATIQETFERLTGTEMTEEELEIELNYIAWVPATDQMMVISSKSTSLASSTEYGRFISYDNTKYITTAGQGKFARPLTTEEIESCF